MTIAISIRVNDGIVLASDSATTMHSRDPDGNTFVLNIYDNANKIYNLHKEIPVGALTWGSGSIGNSSISNIVKDFRSDIIEENVDELLDYDIKEIHKKFIKYIYEDRYIDAFKDWKEKPTLGFMVCGYSKKNSTFEEYRTNIVDGKLAENKLLRSGDVTGLTWNGEPEAITRLYYGFSPGLFGALKRGGIEEKVVKKVSEIAQNTGAVPLVTGPMPIIDAIDLAKFLVETTINFSKYAPGAPTVGGPIEIAAITKHEGFKWVERKHYFSSTFNPTT